MSDSTKTPEERQAIVAALQARLSTEPAAAMKRVMEEEKQTEAAAAKAEKTKGRDSGAMARKAHKIILGYALVAIFLLPSVGADSRGQGFTFQIPSFALMASLGIGVVALLASLVSFRSRPVLRGALTVAALIVFITAGTELYNQPPSGFIYDATGCLTKPKWYETVVTDKNGNRGCAIILEETSIDRSPPKSMCELDVFKDSKMCRTKQN
jgi:hypothetical protein